MQTYHYRAVTESGQVRTGRTQAINLADLESRLTQLKLELIEARVRATASLVASPKTFDYTFVALVRAGEQSGNIPETFRKLADSLKWRDELRSSFKKLLIYPTFGLTIILIVFLFLMIYLVPQLSGFIRSMSGGNLPLQTQVLLGISNFLVNHWWVLLAVPTAVGVAVV